VNDGQYQDGESGQMEEEDQADGQEMDWVVDDNGEAMEREEDEVSQDENDMMQGNVEQDEDDFDYDDDNEIDIDDEDVR
jgi:hypothetical protein